MSYPQNETQDFLFIATERYKFCVLQWDAEKSELITRLDTYSPAFFFFIKHGFMLQVPLNVVCRKAYCHSVIFVD